MNKLLTTEETAELLNCTKSFLEKDRWAGARIPFIKIGGRMVRYRLEDIEEFTKNNLRVSTSDEGQGGKNE
jgi:excisionase family DNA binding protein|tara:strand:+ start:669 stop:881 length:213 start_codon:yes stop_codon:yes gene_type:complete